MNFIVQPVSLLNRARNIEGFNKIEGVQRYQEVEAAFEVAENWTDDHQEGSGFGSSDMTFMIKDLLDTIIMYSKSPVKTTFQPLLKVVDMD